MDVVRETWRQMILCSDTWWEWLKEKEGDGKNAHWTMGEVMVPTYIHLSHTVYEQINSQNNTNFSVHALFYSVFQKEKSLFAKI